MSTSIRTARVQTRATGAVLTLALAAGSCFAQDNAAASFERMLSHQPSTHRPVTAAQRDADPLVAAIVVPLRDGAQRTPVFADADPLARSFARMLSHQPSTHQPVTAAQREIDPLVAVLVEPLRVWRSDAAAAAAPRFASTAR